MKDLKEYTDEEMAAELQRRVDDKDASAKATRLEKCKLVLEHKHSLIPLMSHSRVSCGPSGGFRGSYHSNHGGARCSLCCLELLVERDDIEIIVDISLFKVK